MASSTKSAKQKAAKAKPSKAKKSSSKKREIKQNLDEKELKQAPQSIESTVDDAVPRLQRAITKPNTWQLQDAKSRFSEVVKQAQSGKVQVVTKHGEDAVVIMKYSDYLQLSGQTMTALESLKAPPGLSINTDDLDLQRDPSPGRVFDFED